MDKEKIFSRELYFQDMAGTHAARATLNRAIDWTMLCDNKRAMPLNEKGVYAIHTNNNTYVVVDEWCKEV